MNAAFHLSVLFFVAAILIGLGHYFPYDRFFHRKLNNIEAYTYGTAVICGLASVGFLFMGDMTAIAILLTVAAGAGITTIALYMLDGWTETNHRIEDAKDVADLASKRFNQEFED
jgi:hypothetical protein